MKGSSPNHRQHSVHILAGICCQPLLAPTFVRLGKVKDELLEAGAGLDIGVHDLIQLLQGRQGESRLPLGRLRCCPAGCTQLEPGCASRGSGSRSGLRAGRLGPAPTTDGRTSVVMAVTGSREVGYSPVSTPCSVAMVRE